MMRFNMEKIIAGKEANYDFVELSCLVKFATNKTLKYKKRYFIQTIYYK